LYDLGCYPISAALWAFGHAPVRDVTAQLDVGPAGVDMAADVRVQFDGGEAELHVGMAEPDRQSLVVTGDGGVLELPGQPYTSWRGAGTELRVGGERITVPAVDQYRVMVEDVSSAISGTPAYVVSLDETRSIAEVVDAAFAAGRS
jgi:predicted dehydrogenase